MSDFAPGDKVVCISLRLPCCGRSIGDSRRYAYIPVVGRYYVVGDVHRARCGLCGTPGEYPHQGFRTPDWRGRVKGSWPSACFRKVEPSTEDIFSLASAPKTLEPV